jgi:hypothetical protein
LGFQQPNILEVGSLKNLRFTIPKIGVPLLIYQSIYNFHSHLIIALVATFMIGISRRNTNVDQTYFPKTGGKWVRLTLFIFNYAGLLALFLYIHNLK